METSRKGTAKESSLENSPGGRGYPSNSSGPEHGGDPRQRLQNELRGLDDTPIDKVASPIEKEVGPGDEETVRAREENLALET
ncbi:hypothetical protein QYF36_026382 [Acer negundo]|nr:hypothetical protein QYF36_026382 [Acer negundo]